MYYPLAWYNGPDKSIDPLSKTDRSRSSASFGQLPQTVQSSVVAFELSCDRLLKKLLAFLEVHSETAPRRGG